MVEGGGVFGLAWATQDHEKMVHEDTRSNDGALHRRSNDGTMECLGWRGRTGSVGRVGRRRRRRRRRLDVIAARLRGPGAVRAGCARLCAGT